jgi:hypothetical protein
MKTLVGGLFGLILGVALTYWAIGFRGPVSVTVPAGGKPVAISVPAGGVGNPATGGVSNPPTGVSTNTAARLECREIDKENKIFMGDCVAATQVIQQPGTTNLPPGEK